MRVYIEPWWPIPAESGVVEGEQEITPEELIGLASRFDVMITQRGGEFEHSRLSRKKQKSTPVGPDITIVWLDKRGGKFSQR